MAPWLNYLNCSKEDQLYQEYLDKVYQSTHGYVYYSAHENQTFEKERVCVTYGELLYPSVKKILKKANLSQSDSFLDLGAGLGKCILQLWMQSDLKKIIGIEASHQLVEQGQEVFSRVHREHPFIAQKDRHLLLLQGNFLDENWQQANVIYSCSTCFSDALLIAIGDKINQEHQVDKVLSLRPLPTLNMPLQNVFLVECSWDSALCYFYSRNGSLRSPLFR